MKKVTLAKSAGFCFGVERAVSSVSEILRKENKKRPEERRPIYTFGPIVHNETVIENLKQQGVSVISDAGMLEALPPGIVIIRAHGVSETIMERMKKSGMEIIDASCPFVVKIQKLAEKYTLEGKRVMITGNPAHPEIIGILGWAKSGMEVVPDPECAEKYPPGNGESIVLLSQTTYNQEKFQQIVDIFEKKGYYVCAINTICSATSERQKEARALSRVSDLMIVIGGSSSSNTKKLYEICQSECSRVQLVQTVKDLDFTGDEAVQNVGITAGASTPKEIIEEVLTYVRNEF